MDWLNATLGALTVLGIGATAYYGKKSIRLERQVKQLDYADLMSCANDMAREINRTFKAQVCFTPGLTGATFANLLVGELERWMPVYVGNTFPVDHPPEKIVEGAACQITTSKWKVHIPQEILEHKDDCILIVDDFVMSGDFLQQIKSYLQSEGFEVDQVRSAAIATTQVALKSGKGPDYYWRVADNDDFFFPWGKAR